MATRFVQDRMIYTEIIAKLVPQAQKRLWIATADIKDMYVEYNGSMVPFLKILAELIGKGVEIRLIHAKEPGQPFREDFDRYPRLHKYLERVLCPRVHFKCIIIESFIVNEYPLLVPKVTAITEFHCLGDTIEHVTIITIKMNDCIGKWHLLIVPSSFNIIMNKVFHSYFEKGTNISNSISPSQSAISAIEP